MQPNSGTILSLFCTVWVLVASADDFTKDIGDLPICGQECITTAFAHCKCKLADFQCSCRCLDFQATFESCVQSSCAENYLKPAQNLMSSACASPSVPAAVKPVGTSSITFSSSSVPTTSSISTLTSSFKSSSKTAASYPYSSIVGPACVPIHNMPNSSIPDHGNWTDGIILVNGTWGNNSCSPNSSNGNYPFQVGVNEGAIVVMGFSSFFVVASVALLFAFL